MSDEQRYVVKLAWGAYVAPSGNTTDVFKDAHKASRADAYRIAASWSAHGVSAEPCEKCGWPETRNPRSSYRANPRHLAHAQDAQIPMGVAALGPGLRSEVKP